MLKKMTLSNKTGVSMSLFTIADLHLSLSADKPMDIFPGWENYIIKIEKNWRANIKQKDTVVIGGDISWGMNLKEAKEDFRFIHNLPGKKIMIKGNHDYWFATKTKTEDFLKANGFDSIQMLFNNSFSYKGYSICGTRGWVNETGEENDHKIINREANRLYLSLEAGSEIGEPIVFLHYPPIFNDVRCEKIIEVLLSYNVKEVYYGHIHGPSCERAFNGIDQGIKYTLVSADYLKFNPLKVL